MEEILHTLPPEIARNQMNFIGNHDLARPLTEAGGSLAAVQAAWLLLCLLDGEASMYYGDERAMRGGDDPANRGAMLWGDSQETLSMLAFCKKASALRKDILLQPFQEVHFNSLSEHCAEMIMQRKQTKIRLVLYNANRDADCNVCTKSYWTGDRFELAIEKTL